MSNQLDNFFKNKLHSRSFEYDESAWEDARLLIEENEKTKKRRRWLILFSSVLLISLVGITAYYLGRESVQPIEVTDSGKTIAENTLNEDVFNAAQSAQVDDPRNTPNQAEATKKLRKTVSHKSLSTKDLSLNQIRDRNQGQYQKNIEALNTKDTYRNASGGVGVDHLFNTPVTTTYNPHKDTTATLKQSNTQEKSNQKTIKLEAASLLSSISYELAYITDNDLSELLPKMILSSEVKSHEKISKNWVFGIRAAAGIAPIAFANFDGGIFVQYNINRNISLSLQPHYTYQELAQQAPEENIVTNAFGLRTSSFSLSPESIRSIHAPLLVSYSFGSRNLDLTDALDKRYLKHKISAGISYVYLDGITGNIIENEPVGTSANVEQGWLDDSTFNRHNAEVLFGYEYFLTNRLSVGTMLKYKMQNQFSDDFILQNPTVDQPRQLHISLQALYRLN